MALKSLPTGTYKSPRGQIVARLLSGSLVGKAFVLGDTEFKRTISTELAERFTNEFAVKTKAFSEVDQLNAELEITAYQFDRIAKMVAHMSDVAQADEAAAPDQQVVMEDVLGDEVIVIDARRISGVVVSDGEVEPVNYVEGTHYSVMTGSDGKSFVSLFGKPDGAGDNVQVDYDRLATQGDRYGFGSMTEIMCEIIFVENIKEAAGRTPETHVYHRVGLKVDGDYQMIGNDSTPRTATLKGTIYPDTTKPADYMLGYIDDRISAAA